MKIIDLLNKIANGKEVPKKIKRYDVIYMLDENFNYMNNGEDWLETVDGTNLNDEVEILEEEKKIPEKLEDYDFDDSLDANTKCECLRERMQEIENQLDEIIDYLKSKGDE